MLRTRSLVCALVILALAAVTQVGCGGSSGASATSARPASPVPVRIGVVATEDVLPLWVAEQKGYFAAAGLPKVEILTYPSAAARDAAFSAGQIDGYAGDIITAARLESQGQKNRIITVMLGATPQQGRWGVVVPPGSPVTAMKQLANVPVATTSGALDEYVLNALMAEAGITPFVVKKVESPNLAIRYQLLMTGKFKAAVLPEPYITLAALNGARVVGDDTKSKVSVSESVLVMRDAYLRTPGGAASESALLRSWNQAVAQINQDPAAFRAQLNQHVGLPKELEASYVVGTYPLAQLPKRASVSGVLDWMRMKGYLRGFFGPDDLLYRAKSQQP